MWIRIDRGIALQRDSIVVIEMVWRDPTATTLRMQNGAVYRVHLSFQDFMSILVAAEIAGDHILDLTTT
jgi:hypothetical protein